MNQEIVFFCYDNESGFLVALEPEGMVWNVSKNVELKFIAKNTNSSFKWSVKHNSDSIQLFPDSEKPYPIIEIYKNGILINTFK